MCGVAIFWGILYPDKANSGPYLNSAHGNTTYGVDRTSLSSFGYSKGNCAHCHEQHAKIGGSEPAPVSGVSNYLLLRDNFNTGKYDHPYAQRDDVCFSCHIGTGTYQTPAFSNYSYSYTFGGCSAIDCPAANIMETFNGLSYHNLYDVWRLITGQSGSKIFVNFPEWSNPCSGCHNVHIAQKSCGKPSGSFDTTKAAISKPSGHGNLWGDSAGEKMSDYTPGYQAPYYNSATTYEPDGSNTSEPSKLPDYVAFCTDCHNATNTINSRVLARPLHTINWANEMHGGYAANYCSAYEHTDPPTVPPTLRSLLAPPYDGLNKCGQYVLACTDCHEPHGSPNNFLVRKQVNNGIVTVTSNGTGHGPDGDRDNKEWVWLCGKCHTGLLWGDLLLPHHDANTGLTCTVCHGDDKGNSYKPCSDCHFHGNKMVIPPLTGVSKPLF
jgi:hypothetical protein